MPETTLHAETGRPLGSRAAGRLRTSGKIPGVLYGHGSDPLPIAVEARALRAALSGDAGLNALLTLDLDGKTPQTAMAKDIQRDPKRGVVTHVDFLLVNKDEVITADVPVVLIGDATEVNKNDGVVDQSLFTLTVHAKPGDLPNQIEIDITGMVIGDAIRIDDLDLPAGVKTDHDPDTAIAVAQGPQTTEAEEEAAIAEAAGIDLEAVAAEAAEAEASGEGAAEGEGGGGEGAGGGSDAG